MISWPGGDGARGHSPAEYLADGAILPMMFAFKASRSRRGFNTQSMVRLPTGWTSYRCVAVVALCDGIAAVMLACPFSPMTQGRGVGLQKLCDLPQGLCVCLV